MVLVTSNADRAPVAPVASRPNSPWVGIGVLGDAVTSIDPRAGVALGHGEIDHRVAPVGGIAGGDGDEIAVRIVEQQLGVEAVDELVGAAGRVSWW